MKTIRYILLAGLLTTVACNEPVVPNISIQQEDNPTAATPTDLPVPDADSVFNNIEDLVANTEFSDKTVEIVFNGPSATVTNPWQDAGVEIEQNGGAIVCRATAEERIEYRLSGAGTGSFTLYSEKKVKLVLDGLQLENPDGPALNLQGKKRQFIVLVGENSLLGKGLETETKNEKAKATLFAEGHLLFSGDGSLDVTSMGRHALASDDYVRICSGSLSLHATANAAKDGIHAKDGFAMDGGRLDIEARDEGIQTGDNEHGGFCYIRGGHIAATAANGDGIRASGRLTVLDGRMEITSSHGEGLESKSIVLIEGGDIEIHAQDDAVNAGGLIHIRGGRIYAESARNDAIDSNCDLVIEDGIVVAIAGRTPETALDADQGNLVIHGGTILAIGDRSFMFVEPCTGSTQYSIWTEHVSGDCTCNIQNPSHEDAVNFVIPVLPYSPKILVSSPNLTEGDNTLNSGVALIGGDQWHGLYLDAEHSGGTSSIVVKAQYGAPKHK